MVTYAALQAETWWGREIVTPELDWLGDELCRRTGRPRVAAGSKGDNLHLYGAHRSQEWLLNSRYSTNRTYTIQSGLTAVQRRHIAGFDFTPGSAEAMIAQCQRLMAVVRAGNLEAVRELYGNVDGDQVVDGWDNVRNRAATSDSSHLWHWHLTFDRRRMNDMTLMRRVVAIALGDEQEGGTMLPRYGDGRHNGQYEEVRYWQKMLVEAGFELPQFGIDGDYGDEMATAVAKFWTSIGGSSFSGKLITGHVAVRLQQAVFQGATGPAGPAGETGPRGEAGPAGVLPAEIRIVGTATVTGA